METIQSHRWFLGHTGYVSISWHIVNNVNETYDSSMRAYVMPALDGSPLYVWCDVHLTDNVMVVRVSSDYDLNAQLSDDLEIINL